MPPFLVNSPSSVSTLGASRLGRSRSTSIYGGSPVHNQYHQGSILQVSTKPLNPLSITTAQSAQQQIPSHTFSINWENVLMPTSWLAARMGVSASVQSLQNAAQLLAHTPQLKALMAAIEENIIQLLTQAMGTGAVYIFSERTVQYVELSCSIFFPRLTACLRSATRGVFVVGIPDTDFSAQELAEWKVNILRTVCHERITAGQTIAKTHTDRNARRFGVIALCASDQDADACDQLNKITQFAVTKSVKVAAQPLAQQPQKQQQQQPMSLEDFSAQLQRLTAFVKEALVFNGPIRIAL